MKIFKRNLKIIFSIIFLLLLSGCSVNKLSNSDIASNIITILNDKSKVYNISFEGYKYYLPNGLKIIEKDDYNSVFIDKNDNKYYLYVDIVGFYYKNSYDYKVDDSIHYSKILNNDKKFGYIDVRKKNNKFNIEYVYNYGKIEVICNENDLVDVINYSSSVLNSITYSRNVINSMIGNSGYRTREEEFKLFDEKENKNDFLDIVGKYEGEDYRKARDEEKQKVEFDSTEK